MARVLDTNRILATTTLVVALCLTFAGVGHASAIVGAGFDLFETISQPIDFDAVPNPQTVNFEADPIGCFDFGDGNGCVNTTTTSEIFERITLADLSGGFDTIDIEIVALSLVSIAPVDLGFGAGFEDLFVTLNTSSPSLQSTRTIVDTGEGIPHGTWDQTLNLSFDLSGSVGGFYATIEETILSSGTWSHEHPVQLLIDGVNHNLDGGSPHSHSEDFFIVPIPEPSTALLVGMGLVGLALKRRR